MNKAALPAVEELARHLAAMDRGGARRAFQTGGVGLSPIEQAEQLIVPALRLIGIDWEQGRLALSQIYMASRICESLLDEVIPPHSEARYDQPNMAIAVLDDHHILGKRIVYSMLRASGWELSDLGRVNAVELVGKVREQDIRILLISVLMLRSALKVREVRSLLDEAGLTVRVVVGGAPFRFDEELWRKVGADDTGRDASEAIAAVGRMVTLVREGVQ